MADEGHKFLMDKIEAGTTTLYTSLEQIKKHFDLFDQSRKDVRVYESALEALTRGTDKAYRPRVLPQVSCSWSNDDTPPPSLMMSSSPEDISEPETTETPSSESVDLEKSEPPNKTEALRRIFISKKGTISIEELAKRAARFKSLKITKGFVYRVLPRLVDREEIKRVGRGEYVWIGDSDEDSLFKEDK